MGTKNSLADLNEHLFMALERLSDDSLDEDRLKLEISRARAVSDVAGKAIDVTRTALECAKFRDEKLGDEPLPKMLGA